MKNGNAPPGFTLAFGIGTAAKLNHVFTPHDPAGGNVASRTGPIGGNTIMNNTALSDSAPGAGHGPPGS